MPASSRLNSRPKRAVLLLHVLLSRFASSFFLPPSNVSLTFPDPRFDLSPATRRSGEGGGGLTGVTRQGSLAATRHSAVNPHIQTGTHLSQPVEFFSALVLVFPRSSCAYGRETIHNNVETRARRHRKLLQGSAAEARSGKNSLRDPQ